jgi:hypothetical protein
VSNIILFYSYLSAFSLFYRMPLTPVTAVLFDQTYVQRQWPVLGSRLLSQTSILQPECAAHLSMALPTIFCDV